MKEKLKNLADISTGVFVKPILKGEIIYLQSKHFQENGKLTSELHPNLNADHNIKKHLLYSGDILFSAKGSKNFAAVYETHNLPAVASTSFFVIRLHDENLSPNYLAWYLNNPETKSYLKSKAIGTSIPSISKKALESIEIKIPSLENQKTIVKIFELIDKKTFIYNKLIKLNEKLIQTILINSLKTKV